MSKELYKSIIKTIAFFDIFDFPLKAEEVKKYLYKYNKNVHIKEIKGLLNESEDLEKIGDYYVLKNRLEIIRKRKENYFISEKLWMKTRQYMSYISKVPFVKMIAICNNLAYNNANYKSDIDLFIIIKDKHIWLSRFLISIILQFFGVRRYANKISGRFCLSFFISDKRLNLEDLQIIDEDIYFAYWIKNMRPIYGFETYNKFIEKNQFWVYEKYKLELKKKNTEDFYFKKESKSKIFFEFLFKRKCGKLLENFISKKFKKRTITKYKNIKDKSGTIISDDILKFHNKDKRKEYFEKWNKIIKNIIK